MSTRILARIACLAVAMGIGVLSTPSSGRANMQMEITDGTNYQVLTDSANTGLLNFIGSIGGFTVNCETATSQPPIAPGSQRLCGAGSGLAQRGVECGWDADDHPGEYGVYGADYSTPRRGRLVRGHACRGYGLGLDLGQHQQCGAYLERRDPPSMSGVSGAVNGLSFTSSAQRFLSAGGNAFLNTNGTFSLYQEIVINFTGSAGMFSGDLNNDVTPEPSTMARRPWRAGLSRSWPAATQGQGCGLRPDHPVNLIVRGTSRLRPRVLGPRRSPGGGRLASRQVDRPRRGGSPSRRRVERRWCDDRQVDGAATHTEGAMIDEALGKSREEFDREQQGVRR